MLYRVKAVKCLDVLLEYSSSDLNSLLDMLSPLLEKCGYGTKLYVHILEKSGDTLVDRGVACIGSVKEVLRDSTSRYCRS